MLDIILAIIWIAILVLYIVVGWKDAKSNNEVKKEITQSVYGRKEIRTYGERKTLTIFEAGSDNMGEIIKDRMAVKIGRALKENGAIQFETYDDPMKCGIIVDAKVKIVMP